MKERRFDTRRLVNTKVRLYHPSLGRLDGVTKDISEGGIAVELNSDYTPQLLEPSEEPLFLRPINLDVLFPVTHLRQSENGLVLMFSEED